MSKLVIIPNDIKTVDKIIDHYILLGIKGYSVNNLNIELDYLKELIKKKKNIFITLNKNFTNAELEDLEKLLKQLATYDIKGIFYYDVAIVNIVKRLKLDLNLVWAAEHLTTNYYTINYWYNQGVTSTFLSNEITKDEIISISENTPSHLFVQLFGYIPMYVSKRHAIKNYFKHFNLHDHSKKYYLFKENKYYSITDNEDGTMIYSNFILNGLKEYIELKDKIEYIVINGYNIDSDKLLEIINIFETSNTQNISKLEQKLNELFSNLSKGFLYEETIYKVK